MQAVILAGGKGTRLRPYTNVIPKPLVPLGDKPILEIILLQLRHYGVKEVVLAVNHLAHLIKAFFGNGEEFGLKIRYSLENEPLGTAAPLRMIEGLEDRFLVMNGDLLTTLNFSHLYETHLQAKSDITIGTFQKKLKLDLGVIESDGDKFTNYREKPELNYEVSMGLYVMNRTVLRHIPETGNFDMPDLVLKSEKNGDNVRCYKGSYDWLDIGRIEDYEAAIELFNKNKSHYIPS